jgi:hypothetical protein
VAKVPEECPFPTIVENAIKILYSKEGVEMPREVPRLTKKAKEEILKLEMYTFMLRRNNKALQIKNTEFSNKIIEYEKVIKSLKEDNAILRSLVRKLKNKLTKYEK